MALPTLLSTSSLIYFVGVFWQLLCTEPMIFESCQYQLQEFSGAVSTRSMFSIM